MATDPEKCPYCTAPINAASIKCRHCGKFLWGHACRSVLAWLTAPLRRQPRQPSPRIDAQAGVQQPDPFTGWAHYLEQTQPRGRRADREQTQPRGRRADRVQPPTVPPRYGWPWIRHYLRGADLEGRDLRGADLRGADLREANLSGANLDGIWAGGFPLRGSISDLQDANLRSASLRGAMLSCSILANADLREADLRGAFLSRADLWMADLRGADLRGANLREANLYGANLMGADLQGANLRSANLQRAWLDGANLEDADLRGATFQEEYLRYANLKGADLSGAILISGCNTLDADDPITTPLARRLLREELVLLEDTTTYRPVPHSPEEQAAGQYPVWRVRLDLWVDPPQHIGLDINGEVVLGRGSSDEPNLIDLTPYGAAALGVSRRHLLLRPTDNGLYAVDMGSTNGTRRNEVPLGASPYSLVDRDVLALGDLYIVLNIVGWWSASAPPSPFSVH
jgi:uncharacterized protein YjbI with pentapeptide repeats